MRDAVAATHACAAMRGRVLTIALNRPSQRNALNDGIILTIGDCFANLPESDEEAKRRIRQFLEHKTAKVKPGKS